MGEFYWQRAISRVASKENQSLSAVTGATGYVPEYACLPRCKHACLPLDITICV